jgi:hypothetical protein
VAGRARKWHGLRCGYRGGLAAVAAAKRPRPCRPSDPRWWCEAVARRHGADCAKPGNVDLRVKGGVVIPHGCGLLDSKNLCAGGTRGFPRWKTPRGGLLWHGSGRGAPSGTTASRPPRPVSSHGTACAAREWECDVGAVSVVAGTVGGLTSLRRRHGKVRRHARGMSAARDSSPAVWGTDAPGQQ